MQNPLGQLEGLLVEERDALLAGRLGDLSELGDRKSALVDAIAESQHAGDAAGSAEDITRVSALAERNGALLSEASDALRNTLKRVQELQKIASGEDTYQRDGSRRYGNGPSATLQRRA